MTFSGKTAIVTGGTGALGSECVKQLLELNLNVAIPYTSEQSLSKASGGVQHPSRNVLTLRTDLTKQNEVRGFVASVLKRFGSVEYLINTAGGYAGGNTIDQVNLEEWEGMLTKNARTAFLMSREVLREMLTKRFGRIVNIASMPALRPSAGKGPYAVSKRAVVTLTETIAEETRGSGITANAIAPSIILTEANRKSMPDADVSRWVTPQEIAQLAIYLCSDEARSISGNVVKIYGAV
jgi:NAD(P)-dependent dehydrogenase (short-subunit alcohol dehydrogenase family)